MDRNSPDSYLCVTSSSDPERGAGGEMVISCMGILCKPRDAEGFLDEVLNPKQIASIYLILTFIFIIRKKVLG